MNNYFNGKGTIGFTCDICGREVNGCSIVNGMKFCAKCYQETFGKDNQQNEIQQLKQQLEEKDEQIKKRVMVYEKQFIEQTDEIYSLKQQLAEKDKEIERLKNLFELNNEVVINQGKEIFDLRVQVLQQKQNQTQIAINELAEVERLLYESHYKEIDNKYYAEYEDINNLIDSRIKALEEFKGE